MELIGRRDTKYGSNALTSIISILGILVLINFVFNKRNTRIDLTSAKQFSLSLQTVKILRNLDKDIKIKSFFVGVANAQLEDLLAEYVNISKKIKFEFIDPNKKPAVAEKYSITVNGTSIIECGDRIEKITGVLEQDLTNAIIKASREGKKVIYFVEGHGERDLENYEKDGYSFIKKSLEGENYEIKKIFLAREDNIPEDCAALVSVGPAKEFFPAELDMVDAYINRGGKAFFLLDPEPSPGMSEYFKKWGVNVRNDFAIDYSGIGRLFGAGPGMPLISDYGNHPITNDFRRTATFFPKSRSVAKMENIPEGIVVTELAKTTQRSFGEMNLGKGNKAKFDVGEDTPGPLSLAVAVSKTIPREISDEIIAENIQTKERSGRLVVFGDSDFASNGYVGMQGANMDLFLNVINWLAEEEDLMSIRAKNPEDRRLELTAKQIKFFFYFSIIVLPAFVVISGFIVFAKRKKL